MAPSQQRVPGTFVCPFLYGSIAIPFTKRDVPTDPTHTHKWVVYVRGIQGEDLGYLFKKVAIKIHESFPNANRVFDKPPYEVSESGWGEFQCTIKLTLHDPSEKVITLQHYLHLYTKEDAGTTNTPKKTVVNETYDEIIFTDPVESVYKLISANPVSLPRDKIVGSSFTESSEKEELSKLEKIGATMQNEIDRLKAQIASTESELTSLPGP